MYLFAHLGLGYTMVEVWPAARKRNLSIPFLFAGTLLPDILDKSIYYGLSFATGKHGAELGMIAGTRNFGHTLVFDIALLAVAYFSRSKKVLSLSLGVLTHLILDQISDFAITKGHLVSLHGLLWPIFGWNFPTIPYKNISEQISYWVQPVPLVSEGLGIVALLVVGWLHWRKQPVKTFSN